jgi:peptide/nickel transport system permease protein
LGTLQNSDIVYYFLRDKVAMFSFAVFVVFVLAALLAPTDRTAQRL